MEGILHFEILMNVQDIGELEHKQYIKEVNLEDLTLSGQFPQQVPMYGTNDSCNVQEFSCLFFTISENLPSVQLA